MIEICRREIEELHQFFQDWFNGDLPETDVNFARFSDVMANDFEMVSPNGRSVTITTLQPALRQRYNSWQNGRIWIENVRVHWQKGVLLLVVYEEWQAVDGEENGRLSSVLFQQQNNLPNKLLWLYVHETWLPK
jgi:hypothetical protein